ncbi:halocyanin domain-containing protein [Haloplanus rallus]|uniref:Halocyanin domain-containing protein n=1 Tax=Haloplanus rallus TaxID=1816183 RepID=A0A6B9F9X4_9EURY|nr:halocyanin domain-containing protein [Haloplanus rallus]QGX95071.1 halocyanin domain-containing protein [Haloplanus rallus]
MFDSDSPTRRSVVLSTSALALGGLTALAGCSGGGGGDGGGGEDTATDSGGGGEDTATDSGGGGDAGDGGAGAELQEWFSNVDNYESVVDETGSDQVTVSVGAQGNGGAFAFDPTAIRVSAGTTVLWEWTGQGAQHNVADEGGAFESDLTAEEGFTFEHTFEEAGTYRYACTPHRSLGMKGAVVVE